MTAAEPRALIRSARPDDAKAIVGLVLDGLTPLEVELSIYGCRGVERYVAEQIGAADTGGESLFVVAQDAAGEVAGFAEFRRRPGTVHLNNIFVQRERRGLGLGNRLMAAGLARAAAGVDRVSLDVHERNEAAARWYGRLGFERDHSTTWWRVPLTGLPAGNAGTLIEDDRARASQSTFGFSQVRVSTASGVHQVGRLGDRWFRVTDATTCADASLRRVLAQHDEGRELLAALTDEPLPVELGSSAQPLQLTVRMGAPLDLLLDRCSNDRPTLLRPGAE